jgi:hypothetical protein
MRTQILLSFVLIISFGCSSRPGKNSDPEKVIPTDSLAYFSYDKKVISVELKWDTLNIVTTNQFAYYPFGKYFSIEEFNNYLNSFNLDVEQQYPNNDTLLDLRVLYNLSYRDTKIKVLSDPENKTIEIVSGKILDPELKLVNGFQVGMTKAAFIDSLFSKKPADFSKIKVVEIESGLMGIWHYYIFEHDTLKSILLDTDYQFNK